MTAKRQRYPVDRSSDYHQELRQLAAMYSKDMSDLVDEWSERSAAREYFGNLDREDAERLAFQDVTERLASG